MFGLGEPVLKPIAAVGIITLTVTICLLIDVLKKPCSRLYIIGCWTSIGMGVLLSWFFSSGEIEVVLLFGLIPILVGIRGLLKTRS